MGQNSKLEVCVFFKENDFDFEKWNSPVIWEINCHILKEKCTGFLKHVLFELGK